MAREIKRKKIEFNGEWADVLPIATFVLDHANTIIYGNKAFLKLLGATTEEILGASLESALGETDSRDLLKLIIRTYGGNTERDPAVVIHRRDNQDVTASLTLAPVFERTNHVVVNVIGMIQESQPKKLLRFIRKQLHKHL